MRGGRRRAGALAKAGVSADAIGVMKQMGLAGGDGLDESDGSSSSAVNTSSDEEGFGAGTVGTRLGAVAVAANMAVAAGRRFARDAGVFKKRCTKRPSHAAQS